MNAVSLDPTSREFVGNLGKFYEGAQSGRIKVKQPAAEIARQLEQATRAAASMSPDL